MAVPVHQMHTYRTNLNYLNAINARATCSCMPSRKIVQNNKHGTTAARIACTAWA
jgi:hypothetical protein